MDEAEIETNRRSAWPDDDRNDRVGIPTRAAASLRRAIPPVAYLSDVLMFVAGLAIVTAHIRMGESRCGTAKDWKRRPANDMQSLALRRRPR